MICVSLSRLVTASSSVSSVWQVVFDVGRSPSQGLLLRCVFYRWLIVGGRRGAASRGHSVVCRAVMAALCFVWLILLRIRSVM